MKMLNSPPHSALVNQKRWWTWWSLQSTYNNLFTGPVITVVCFLLSIPRSEWECFLWWCPHGQADRGRFFPRSRQTFDWSLLRCEQIQQPPTKFVNHGKGSHTEKKTRIKEQEERELACDWHVTQCLSLASELDSTTSCGCLADKEMTCIQVRVFSNYWTQSKSMLSTYNH